MRNLQRLARPEQFAKTGYLLKNSFTIIGRDWDIVRPWIRSTIYGIIAATPMFIAIAIIVNSIILEDGSGIGLAVLLILVWMWLAISKHFFFNKQEIRQSWLVAETVRGKDRSYREAKDASKELKKQIRWLAILDIAVARFASRGGSGQSEGGGLGSGLANLIASGLTEVWDLLNHYLIPAVTIDGVSIKDGVGTVKELKDRVPQTLMGVFGIDFIGSVVRSIMAPVYLVLIVISLAIGVLAAGSLASFVIPIDAQLPQWLLTGGSLQFAPFPLILLIFIGRLFSIVVNRAVTAVKVLYFTIFYMQITHSDEIAEDLQPELEAFLKMDEEAEFNKATEKKKASGE